MNNPTREEFDELKEEVRKLKQQVTDEIKTVKVEVASADVNNRLTILKDDVGVLKVEMQGARADILQIRESQADLRDRLIEHGEDLKVIKDKQDAHTELLGQLIGVGEEIKTTMATKDDINQINAALAEILKRLPERGE